MRHMCAVLTEAGEDIRSPAARVTGGCETPDGCSSPLTEAQINWSWRWRLPMGCPLPSGTWGSDGQNQNQLVKLFRLWIQNLSQDVTGQDDNTYSPSTQSRGRKMEDLKPAKATEWQPVSQKAESELEMERWCGDYEHSLPCCSCRGPELGL